MIYFLISSMFCFHVLSLLFDYLISLTMFLCVRDTSSAVIDENTCACSNKIVPFKFVYNNVIM